MSFLRCLLFHENCMVTIKTVLNHLRKLVNDLADDLLARYQRCQDRSRVAGPSPRFRGGRARLSNPGCRTNVDGHPGFATSMSVSLHRFGTDPDYENWRTDLLGLKKFLPAFRISDEKTGNQKFGPDATDVFTAIDAEMTARLVQRVAPIQIGKVLASVSERSTTPLFGSGLIDAIPDAVIEAAARAQADSKVSPKIHGRVSRLADGRIGRFGWKGQTARLEDFVLTACAVELGLEVPGHHQAPDPLCNDKKAAGLDLSAQDVAPTVSMVRRDLP